MQPLLNDVIEDPQLVMHIFLQSDDMVKTAAHSFVNDLFSGEWRGKPVCEAYAAVLPEQTEIVEEYQTKVYQMIFNTYHLNKI